MVSIVVLRMRGLACCSFGETRLLLRRGKEAGGRPDPRETECDCVQGKEIDSSSKRSSDGVGEITAEYKYTLM